MKKHIAFYVDQTSSGSPTAPVTGAPEVGRHTVRGHDSKPRPTVELDLQFIGGRLDDKQARRLVLVKVLDDMFASLRMKRAVTYGFSAGFEPRVAGGLWWINGDADATRAEEAGRAVAEILADMRRDPETYRAAFVAAREKTLESLLSTANSSGAVADRLVYQARFGLDDDYYNRLAKAVAALTLADIEPIVRSELSADHQVFGAFGNDDAVEAALRGAGAVPPHK